MSVAAWQLQQVDQFRAAERITFKAPPTVK